MVILVKEAYREEAQTLAKRFGFPLKDKVLGECHLVYGNGRWLLKDESFVIQVDFNETLKRLSHQRLSVKKDLLSRAVGLDKRSGAKVLDATLGLGKDAFHLAFLGAQVTGVESDPIPFLLVESALNDEALSQIKGSLGCFNQNSEDFLNEAEQQFDALYLDPMFEDTDKKSLPKKEMQFLRSRQVENRDYTEIIEHALRKGIERVVVKRPLKGSELYPEPQTKLSGKMIRYDVYRTI